MKAADRNLSQINQQERPDIYAARNYLTQIFESVGHMHKNKLMHGDLKLLNVVQFQRDNRLHIIDLDASAPIPEFWGSEELFAGVKFSSASLPPEMIYELKDDKEKEQLETYWEDESLELRTKVAPKEHTRRKIILSSWRDRKRTE